MGNAQRGVVARVAVLVVGMTVLAGCGSQEDPPVETQSPSSSSSASAPSSSSTTPSDPDGARAITVVKGLEKATNELRLDSTKATGALGAYATDEAYRQRDFSIRKSREAGERYEGKLKVAEASATKVSATRQKVTACTDLSSRKIFDKAGTEIETPHDRLGHVYTVDKSDGSGQDGKWRVTAEKVTTAC